MDGAGPRRRRRRAAHRPRDQRRVADAGAAAGDDRRSPAQADAVERVATAIDALARRRGRARGDRGRAAGALDGTPTPQTRARARRSSPRCRTRTTLTDRHRGRAADEPRSREPARACTSATGASARQQLDAAAAAVILQDYLDRAARPDERSCCRVAVAGPAWLLVAGAAAGRVRTCASTSRTAATTGAEQFVEIPPGAGSLAHRRAAGRRPACPRSRRRFALALWMSGQGRQLKAGEYRFDRAMTPFEVIDKIARGDVYRRPRHVPRGADDRRDGEDLRGARARAGRGVRRGRAGRRADSRPRSGREGSRRLSVSRNLRAAAPHRRARSSCG